MHIVVECQILQTQPINNKFTVLAYWTKFRDFKNVEFITNSNRKEQSWRILFYYTFMLLEDRIENTNKFYVLQIFISILGIVSVTLS